jgi:quercetin dioxygenase-like cupin family protein
MKIHNNLDIEFQEVQMEGAENVKMKILIGLPDGSNNIIMRHFQVAQNGHTPRHTHDFEHVIKVEKNKGIFVDKNGTEHELKEGMSLFVEPNEEHQFKNPYNEPFEFLCIIPNANKNNCCINQQK